MVRNHEIDITEIIVGDISASSVNDMVLDLFRAYKVVKKKPLPGQKEKPKEVVGGKETMEQLQMLAQLCHKKTGGNPFYLIHFITKETGPVTLMKPRKPPSCQNLFISLLILWRRKQTANDISTIPKQCIVVART